MNSLREYFDQLAQGEILEQKQRDFAIEPLKEGAMFTYARESTLGSVRERWALHRLGCSHLALGPQEYLGECDRCSKSICVRPECHARCQRCGILLCATCIRKLEGNSFCPSCRRIELLKQGAVLGLRGLHALLSKEF